MGPVGVGDRWTGLVSGPVQGPRGRGSPTDDVRSENGTVAVRAGGATAWTGFPNIPQQFCMRSHPAMSQPVEEKV